MTLDALCLLLDLALALPALLMAVLTEYNDARQHDWPESEN